MTAIAEPIDDDWAFALRTIRPALLLGPVDILNDVRNRLETAGVREAVAVRNTAAIFDWMVNLVARQGISNHAAEVFSYRNGSPLSANVAATMATEARCPRLRSYWHFSDCQFRRAESTCNTPHHRVLCPVTLVPARKGTLAEAVIGLWLFVRDVCGDDIVGWIDDRLEAADPGIGHPQRAARMRAAAMEPLVNISGTGSKVWAMILAELLIAGDPHRERWVTTGSSFVAIDSLVHNFLHRTGILRKLQVDHAYGPKCYGPNGCLGVIEGFAARIDAREFNSTYPARFDRWVQYAIWHFCSQGGWGICNGDRIGSGTRCAQPFCPAFSRCERIAIKPSD